MICPKCNSNNREGAKFCDECGTVLQDTHTSHSKTIVLPRIDSEEVEADDFAVEAEAEADSDTVDQTNQPRDSHAQTIAFDSLHGLDVSSENPELLYSWERGGTVELPVVESGSNRTNSRSYRVELDEKKPVKKMPIIIAALILLIAAGVAFGTWYFELWGGVRVPDVVGLTETSAKDVLVEKGFQVRVEQVKSDDEEGIVLLTDPNSGSRTEENGTIVIHVSVARTIPSVVGLDAQEAQRKLAAEGYENVTLQAEKSNETENSVLSVEPAEGEKIKAAYPIVIHVAQAYTVPNVLGNGKDAAVAALEAEGYVVVEKKYYTEDTPEGTIVSTEPEAGTKLPSGSEVIINIAVSRASELESLTRSLLYPEASISISGTSYLIKSLNSVSYEGSDTVAFSAEAQPYTTFLGEVIYLSVRTVTGHVVWSSDNAVSSITG